MVQLREDERRRAQQDNAIPGASTVLTANQIIIILHEKAEVAIDLKQVMADYFAKRGISVQADSITDDILFSNIASNAGLRREVSVWLRARGYADDTQFGQSRDSTAIPEPADPLSREDSRATAQEPSDEQAQIAFALKDLPTGSEAIPLDPALAARNQPEAREPRPVPNGVSKRNETGDLLQPKLREERKLEDIDTVHQPTPYNLQSMRDLYTQVPEQTVKVKRFGSEVFLHRGFDTKQMPIDLPVGPDYILGPGDGINISLWGSVSQTFTRVVDREGKIILPEAGPVVVAGQTLEHTQSLVQGALSRQFHDARVSVSVARLRTVRVYVVGDVQRPGAYDISSLSTPLNALYAAGGPTSVGSLRTLQHLRGKTKIRELDLYDFLRNGVRSDIERMEPGDTILVPPAGPQVEVSGMVKRPAIYELKGQETLVQVLDEAGGLQVSAALTHIRIERVAPGGHRVTSTVDLPEGSTLASATAKMNGFDINDGDRIIVAPILPYSEKAIYIAGHVVRPGKLPYRDNLKLSDVLRTYQDLLPEPSDRGEIVRLIAPDLHPEAIEFSVSEVLTGSAPFLLQPFDTIRIHGRYESDAPRVTVRGEVLHPGTYALADGMTAAQLVRIAGGFRRGAMLEDADLASYTILAGKQVESHDRRVAIGRAVNDRDLSADIPLKPGDVLSIHQISGWNDIGSSALLMGEVSHPGTYGVENGERLSAVIRRAGGFRSSAYPDGAILIRRQVKELEEKSRAEMIRQIETSSVGAKLGTSVTGGEDTATLQLLIQQQTQILQRLKAQPAVGRLVIKISSDIASWEGTPADIELRSGDVLSVPKRPGFVLVSGQIYNPSAITFVPGKDAGWYLSNAGGATDLANRKEIFIIRADGLVVGRRSGERHEKVLSTRLNPGDVIVVPQKIVGGSVFWKNTLAAAQVVSSIAFTAALALR